MTSHTAELAATTSSRPALVSGMALSIGTDCWQLRRGWQGDALYEHPGAVTQAEGDRATAVGRVDKDRHGPRCIADSPQAGGHAVEAAAGVTLGDRRSPGVDAHAHHR